MPITRPIVLANVVGGGNETFNFLHELPDGARYLAASATDPSLPWLLNIRHSNQNVKGVGIVDQHLVQSVRSVLCADGVIRSMVGNNTVRVPRDAAFTATIKANTLGVTGSLWYLTDERAALFLNFS